MIVIVCDTDILVEIVTGCNSLWAVVNYIRGVSHVNTLTRLPRKSTDEMLYTKIASDGELTNKCLNGVIYEAYCLTSIDLKRL